MHSFLVTSDDQCDKSMTLGCPSPSTVHSSRTCVLAMSQQLLVVLSLISSTPPPARVRHVPQSKTSTSRRDLGNPTSQCHTIPTPAGNMYRGTYLLIRKLPLQRKTGHTLVSNQELLGSSVSDRIPMQTTA